MEADITGPVSSLILLFAVGSNLAGRDGAWSHLRWPWVAIMTGKLAGLKITAPVSIETADLADTTTIWALAVACATAAARWICRRYGGSLFKRRVQAA